MAYDKPKVTIDLDEYNNLLKKKDFDDIIIDGFHKCTSFDDFKKKVDRSCEYHIQGLDLVVTITATQKPLTNYL